MTPSDSNSDFQKSKFAFVGICKFKNSEALNSVYILKFIPKYTDSAYIIFSSHILWFAVQGTSASMSMQLLIKPPNCLGFLVWYFVRGKNTIFLFQIFLFALAYFALVHTLQELKLESTNIRDGVVLSWYLQNKWFAKHLSIFWAKEQIAL